MLRRWLGLSRNAQAFVRACSVYVPAAAGRMLVASMSNHAGLYAEVQGGVAECRPGDAAALGALLVRQLAACRFAPDFDYSRQERSDWPAYQASGLTTVKAFEEAFHRYLVHGANGANLVWQIESAPFRNGASLVSSRSSGSDPEELGAWVLEFHRFHMDVRAGVARRR